MNSKLIGSILLIVGTSIGAGMLALPIATAELGFLGSLVLLFIGWIVMTAGAFLLLEVCLWMPHNSNLVTMARRTIGPIGQIIAWVIFLLLLYSLLSAYISGGSGLLQHILVSAGVNLSPRVAAIGFTIIFGTVVFLGIKAVDYVNRGLMFAKLIGYGCLVILLVPFIDVSNLMASDPGVLKKSAAFMVTISAFGYSTIVPSLRIYAAGDIKMLKKAIFIGSLIPLTCYILWDLVIMGVIPLDGANGMLNILHSDNSTSALVTNLTATASTAAVTLFVKLFSSVCVLTSFLGVSLCLTDFLADGFELEKVGFNKIIIVLGTYIPPLLIVMFYPNAFIKALTYAGVYSVILLILIPAWMALVGRKKHPDEDFKVPGGTPLLVGLILFSIATVVYSLVV
jgi:tyrosine-specific transport protein